MTRYLSDTKPSAKLRCVICAEDKPAAANFSVRRKSAKNPDPRGDSYKSACHGCQRVLGRERSAGRPSDFDTIRRLVQAGAVVKPLKRAGHTKGARKRPTDPKLAEAARLEAEARALRAEAENSDPSGFVYLIAEADANGKLISPFARFAVKIGKSKAHPRYRLPGLQTGNPRKLALLGFIKTDDRSKLEKELHAKFAHLNVLQEWFRPTAALMSEFGLLADGSRQTRRAA